MRPPYEITNTILKAIASIAEKIGAVNANFLNNPPSTLKTQNRLRTIHASLKLDGNNFTESQIAALLEDKKIFGSQKNAVEVLNAFAIYENLERYNPNSEKAFLKAHQKFMSRLTDDAGEYKKQMVSTVAGSETAHLAPSSDNIQFLMKGLFQYLQKEEEIELIKSCVFHYEMAFIRPFSEGNGRMARLWQTLILMQKYPLFEFVDLDTLIYKDQKNYNKALSDSDKSGQSTPFIEYMLLLLDHSIGDLLNYNNRTFNEQDRLEYFVAQTKEEFTRKHYMSVFKDISSATASRDLKSGLELNLFEKTGEKNKTIYKLITPSLK
mgnify:CR=1 FL=1